MGISLYKPRFTAEVTHQLYASSPRKLGRELLYSHGRGDCPSTTFYFFAGNFKKSIKSKENCCCSISKY